MNNNDDLSVRPLFIDGAGMRLSGEEESADDATCTETCKTVCQAPCQLQCKTACEIVYKG